MRPALAPAPQHDVQGQLCVAWQHASRYGGRLGCAKAVPAAYAVGGRHASSAEKFEKGLRLSPPGAIGQWSEWSGCQESREHWGMCTRPYTACQQAGARLRLPPLMQHQILATRTARRPTYPNQKCRAESAAALSRFPEARCGTVTPSTYACCHGRAAVARDGRSKQPARLGDTLKFPEPGGRRAGSCCLWWVRARRSEGQGK